MTLDSNIIIAYLSGEKIVVETLLLWKEEGRIIFLPAVVETEVLSFAGMNKDERQRTEAFLESLSFISFDRNMARLAAEIRSVIGMKFPDAAIAATALAMHTPIVTRNVKDFNRIVGLTVVTI